MADIVLINPRFDTSYWGLNYALDLVGAKALLPPASLPLLAALTPAEHTVTLIDENVQPIDFERCARADIVGLTGMNVQQPRMHEIVAELKRRGIFTIMGGAWVTVSEADFADLVDVIFVGEAEDSWPQFLAEWSEGRHQRRYEQVERTDMAKVPAPRLDMLPMKKYLIGSVQFSRGCPFNCEFCDIIVTFGRRPRIKTAPQIIAELEGLMRAGKRTVFIVDDNLIGNKKAIKPLLREVIAWQQERSYPMTFSTEASVDLGEDPELMQLMADLNITEVFVGVESVNEASLRETKKIQNLQDKSGTMLEKIHRIQQAGIEVWCGLIVGFDNDDESIFAAQHRFAHDARVVHAIINMLVAIPRTPLYKRLKAAGRLDLSTDSIQSMGAFGTNVIHPKLSAEVLRTGALKLMSKLAEPADFFARVNSLYLDFGLVPGRAKANALRRRPRLWLKVNTRLVIEIIGIYVQLSRNVSDPALLRAYRSNLLRAAFRTRRIDVLHRYAIKCIMHFHAYSMMKEIEARPQIRALLAA